MLKKPNILVVGSFMMDLIASTKRAPNSGETVIGLKFQTAPGGKGANQAVQCARLGAHVTMVGQVGDDAFGKIMTDTAAAAGVDVSHVSVDPQESSGVGHITLEVTEHGAQNRITVCPGANFTITVDDRNISFIKPGDYVDLDWNGTTYQGVVTAIDMGKAESGSGMTNYPVTLTVENYDGSLMDGAWLQYSFVTSESSDCILVPTSGLSTVYA